MRKLTCIFQCCLWPSSSNCPPRLQLDPPRRFGLERFVRSGHSGWTLAGALTHPPQPAPSCKEPRRASALGPTPGGPFRPRKGARRSPSKACVFPPCRNEACPKVEGSQGRREEFNLFGVKQIFRTRA